jgi:branched-chain amino acid aminotransferase
MELIAPMQIPVRKTSHSLHGEVDWDHLEFGKYSTDHMLVCDYADGAWGAPQILPFGDFSLSPSALGLHYGQTVFEGMKAFRQTDGKINIFRPRKHYERLQKSTERLCMPVVSWEVFIEGLRQLVELDKDWVPATADSSLYIRPFIIATEARLGVKISDAYRFAIVCTPSGPLYPQPIRVKVEKDFVRAARGGTGFAKCGGNYGGAFYPARKAKEEGYDQVLWTDGKENRFIEESGTMNVLFVINRKLVTPPLSDSILDGVTRDSLIALARKDGITVEERPVCIEEIQLAFEERTISEAFGAGTAAVVSPIRTIGIGGIDYDLPTGGQRGLAFSLRAKLDALRYGNEPDPFGWNYLV